MDDIAQLRARVEACHDELAELRNTRILDGFARLYAGFLVATVILPCFPVYAPHKYDGFTVTYLPLYAVNGDIGAMVWFMLASVIGLLATVVFKRRVVTIVVPIALAVIAVTGACMILGRVGAHAGARLSGTGMAIVALFIGLLFTSIVHMFAIGAARDAESNRRYRNRIRRFALRSHQPADARPDPGWRA